jgi:hypothetical protein
MTMTAEQEREVPKPHHPASNCDILNLKLFYVQPSGHFGGLTKALNIFNVSSYTSAEDRQLTKPLVHKVKKSIALESLSPTFTMKRENLAGSRLAYFDEAGENIAEWEMPILAFGTSKIIFAAELQYSSHAVTIEPLGTSKRGVKFVKDSVLFKWDAEREEGEEHYVLFKTTSSEKSVIGGLLKDGHQGGLVAADDREVDVLVAIMGCVAILQRRDSFTKRIRLIG